MCSKVEIKNHNVPSTWHEWMPQVAASLNSSSHSSIGNTCHCIVFDQDRRLPYSVLLQKDYPVYNFDDYVRLGISYFNKTYKRVQQTIAKAQQVKNQLQDKTVSHRLLVICEVIFVELHETINKFITSF